MMKIGTPIKVHPVDARSGAPIRCWFRPFMIPGFRKPELEVAIRLVNRSLSGLGMDLSCDVEIKTSWGRLVLFPDDARDLASLLRKAANEADAAADAAYRESR